MKFLLAIALTALAILSCQDEALDNSVTISGTITNPAGEKASLTTRNLMGEPIVLGEATLDSAGSFTMSFDLDAPTRANFGHGQESTAMYVRPGDDISLTLTTEEFDESITYSGTGAGINNYLAQKYMKEEQYMASLEPSNMYKMELDTFLLATSELEELLLAHLEEMLEGTDVSDEFIAQEKLAIKVDDATRLENYPRYHGYYTGDNDFEVDASYYRFRDEIPMEDEYALDVPAFRNYLSGYASRKLDAIIESDSALRNDIALAYRMSIEALQDDGTLPPVAKDYLVASEINKYIGYFGPEGIDPYLAWYREHSINKDYLATINETFEAWAEIGKGQPAPDFKYKNLDGDRVALSDFTGKVVYVDIWATWCGPCKREIPHSKTLKEKYADNDKVVFMYVSVDENQEAWRQYLADDPEFKGIHLIAPDGQRSSINEDYLINGIPRYMLIDQENKIVNASAPRPSSGQVERLIDELLTKA